MNKIFILTTLYCIRESISASMAKSKQSAENKQTADTLKNHNFSYLATLYCINKAISAFILLYLTNLARKKKKKKPNIIY